MIQANTPKARLVFYKWVNLQLNDKFIQTEIEKLSLNLSLRERNVIKQIVQNVPSIPPPADTSMYYRMVFWFYAITMTPIKGNIFLALRQFDPKAEFFTVTWVKNSEATVTLLNRYLQRLEIEPQNVGLQHLNAAFGLADLLSN